jgi:hypothetical protein
MSIASVRRSLRPFACDRHGDAAPGDNPPRQVIDARAREAGRQTLRDMARRGRGGLAQMMAGRALLDCGEEWWLARVRLVQSWAGRPADVARADALLDACGVPAGVQTDIFGHDEAEAVEVER